MVSHRLCRALLWTLFALSPGLVRADIYVLFDGIQGNGSEPSHLRWINATSANWSIERAVAPQPIVLTLIRCC